MIGFILLVVVIIVAFYMRGETVPLEKFPNGENLMPWSPFIRSKVESTKRTDLDLYRKRYRVMNNNESSFYHLLQKELGIDYHVFPKMRIADIVETMDGRGYYKQRNQILPKHVDFVVCNQRLEPVLAIEVDGKSHTASSVVERDIMVNAIFEHVGIPLKRVPVGSDFQSQITEMASSIKKSVQ